MEDKKIDKWYIFNKGILVCKIESEFLTDLGFT